MGTTNTKDVSQNVVNRNLLAFIKIDQPKYVSGETIKGTVFVNVLNNFRCAGINLYLTGSQYFRFVYYVMVGSGKSRRRVKQVAVGSEQIFDCLFGLTTFADIMIPIGHYAFPFCIATPVNIPGSFVRESYSEESGSAHVSYMLSVMTYPQIPGLSSMIANRQVEINYCQLTGNTITRQLSMYPNYCCCFKRGRVSMNCFLDIDVILPGIEFSIFYQVHAEESLLDISKIEVRIVQNFSVGYPDQRNWGNKIVIAQSIESGVLRGQTVQNFLKMRIPQQCPGSIFGKIVQLHYFLELEPKSTDQFCMEGMKFMAIPMTVNPYMVLNPLQRLPTNNLNINNINLNPNPNFGNPNNVNNYNNNNGYPSNPLYLAPNGNSNAMRNPSNPDYMQDQNKRPAYPNYYNPNIPPNPMVDSKIPNPNELNGIDPNLIRNQALYNYPVEPAPPSDWNPQEYPQQNFNALPMYTAYLPPNPMEETPTKGI